MGLFSWLKRREVGVGPGDEKLEQARADHKKAVASLRRGRKTVSTTLEQISLIAREASSILEENEGEINGDESIGEAGEDSSTAAGSHGTNGLYTQGNQGVEPV